MKYYLTLIFCNENSAEYLWFYLEADYHHPSKDKIFDHPCFITKLLPLKTFFLESKRASSKKSPKNIIRFWILIANEAFLRKCTLFDKAHHYKYASEKKLHSIHSKLQKIQKIALRPHDPFMKSWGETAKDKKTLKAPSKRFIRVLLLLLLCAPPRFFFITPQDYFLHLFILHLSKANTE